MGGALSVRVCGDDAITVAGVVAQLSGRPDVFVIDDDPLSGPDVGVVVVERLDERATTLVHDLRSNGHAHVVAVCGQIDDDALMSAVELGVIGLLRRCEATPERLQAMVLGAAPVTV